MFIKVSHIRNIGITVVGITVVGVIIVAVIVAEKRINCVLVIVGIIIVAVICIVAEIGIVEGGGPRGILAGEWHATQCNRSVGELFYVVCCHEFHHNPQQYAAQSIWHQLPLGTNHKMKGRILLCLHLADFSHLLELLDGDGQVGGDVIHGVLREDLVLAEVFVLVHSGLKLLPSSAELTKSITRSKRREGGGREQENWRW